MKKDLLKSFLHQKIDFLWISKAVIYEALNRARSLGAKKAYVLSDMPFYEKLGFRKDKHFTFYWKG